VRIWSLHPKYLDARGLVALWREALLAQAVLEGKTNGYVHHPQLLRFRAHDSPVGSIAEYLRVVHDEATTRGYRFAAERITRTRALGPLTVTHGQLRFEWRHLLEKLRMRDAERLTQLTTVSNPQPHPLFRVVRGGVAQWERVAAPPEKPLQWSRGKRRAAERRR
jgi:Pyrimidine dimer DNA glycosylase